MYITRLIIHEQQSLKTEKEARTDRIVHREGLLLEIQLRNSITSLRKAGGCNMAV